MPSASTIYRHAHPEYAEEVKEDPKAKNVKKAPEVKKAPVKGAKGAEVIPDGTVL
jgi:hypothetical protein